MTTFWTDAELIVAVYFISRGFTDAAVSQTLRTRGFRRSCAAVRRKVQDIQNKYPHLRSTTGEWDFDAVDFWLDKLSLDYETVSRLISCTHMEGTIAEKVRHPALLKKKVSNLSLIRVVGSMGLRILSWRT